MSTEAEAIDRLALNQPRRVADLSCPRYKALDMSIADTGWERAMHLEHMPQRRELVTSSKKEKSARLPRSSETKLASSPTSTVRKVSGNIEEHIFRKKVRMFPGRESKQPAAEAKEHVEAFGAAPAGRVVCTGMSQTQTKLPTA